MAIKIENNQISLAVRDLITLNKKSGKMLSSFPLPQRGMLGQKAHIRVQQQKSKSFGLFHHEYGVSGEFSLGEYNFHVSGRIDGAYELKNRIEIEEIKSVILTPADFQKFQLQLYPEFSEQVLFYSYLLHKERKGIEITPYLTLINLANDKTRSFSIDFSPLAVERILFQRFQVILDDILREEKIRDERKKQLKSIRFPLHEYRPQQEKMMETVRSCLSQETHLLVSAPTGTGKTAAALYPSLEFAIEQQKKIIFSTSKTTQQKI
jgi:DNA excision repair protein ERCC-2